MNKQDIARIKRIKARVNKATPGKWVVEKYYHDEPYEEYIKSAAVVTKYGTITRNDWSNPVKVDLEFIANARQDIPYLLYKVDELSERNRELAEKLRELYEQSKSTWGADLEIEKLLEGVEL